MVKIYQIREYKKTYKYVENNIKNLEQNNIKHAQIIP